MFFKAKKKNFIEKKNQKEILIFKYLSFWKQIFNKKSLNKKKQKIRNSPFFSMHLRKKVFKHIFINKNFIEKNKNKFVKKNIYRIICLLIINNF